MISISQTDIANMARLERLARLSAVRDKIRWFEHKYFCSFEEFEARVKTGDENFEEWDDYMEWKAYQRVRDDLQHDIIELQHGNFEITR